MALNVGDTIEVRAESRKATTVWEKLVADDDGIISDTRKYVLIEALREGDICQVFKATDATSETVVVKVCRLSSDNDLAENEAKILNKIHPATAKEEAFYRYIPRIIESIEWEGLRINVLPYYDEWITLADILKAYPNGIDYRDMAWMFKRMLEGVGFSHTRGVIHGAVLPPHVLVHPVNHGAKIIDWSYAVEASGRYIPAMSFDYEAYYPLEIPHRANPTPATDIYMMAKCALALLVGEEVKPGSPFVANTMPDTVPRELQDLLLECLQESRTMRPQDAWKLHEQFDVVLKKVVGGRKYRPFAMPESTRSA